MILHTAATVVDMDALHGCVYLIRRVPIGFQQSLIEIVVVCQMKFLEGRDDAAAMLDPIVHVQATQVHCLGVVVCSAFSKGNEQGFWCRLILSVGRSPLVRRLATHNTLPASTTSFHRSSFPLQKHNYSFGIFAEQIERQTTGTSRLVWVQLMPGVRY